MEDFLNGLSVLALIGILLAGPCAGLIRSDDIDVTSPTPAPTPTGKLTIVVDDVSYTCANYTPHRDRLVLFECDGYQSNEIVIKDYSSFHIVQEEVK